MSRIIGEGNNFLMVRYNLKKILIEEHELDIEDTFYSKYDEVPKWTPHDWEVGDADPEDPFYVQSDEWHKYQQDLRKHIEKTLHQHIEDNPAVIHPQLTRKTKSGDKIDWVDDFVVSLNEPNPAFYDEEISPEDLKYRKNHTGIMIKNDHITNSRAQTWTDMFDSFYGPGTTKDKLASFRSGLYVQDNAAAKWRSGFTSKIMQRLSGGKKYLLYV